MKLLFVLILTLLLALSGCEDKAIPATPTVEAPTATIEIPVDEPVEVPVEAPVEEPAVTPTETPEPDEEAPADLPERLVTDRELMSDDGTLWYVPARGHFEHLVMQKLVLWGERLVAYGSGVDAEEDIVYDEPGLFFHSIYPRDNTRSASRTAFLDDPVVQICGDTRVTMDWSTGSIKLNPSQEKYQLDTANSPIYLSTDVKTAYLFRRDSGITAITLATGEKHTLLTAEFVLLSAKCGDTVAFSYRSEAQDTFFAALDLTDGSITACPHDELRFGVEALGELWLGAIDDETYLLGNHSFSMPEGCSAATLLEDGRLMLYAATPEQMTLYLYETDGSFVSRCILPEGYQGPNSDPVWVEADGGYYLLAATPDGHDVLLFWDLSYGGSGEDLSLNPIPAK